MQEGASGYVVKNIDREELIKAVLQIAKGKKFFSNDIVINLLEDNGVNQIQNKADGGLPEISQLSKRELEVLKLIGQGLSNREISEQLYISARTVDTHRTNIMRKLEVHNVAGLIRIAFHHGLVV